jgi:hypothetical protein
LLHAVEFGRKLKRVYGNKLAARDAPFSRSCLGHVPQADGSQKQTANG